MKILHVSDTHTRFPKFVGDYNVIVHSGDLLPNIVPRSRIQDPLYQRDWIRDNAENFKNWIGDKPFLFCSGNHDYIDPCPELIDIGINAINIDNKFAEIDGIKFYGFPYVPYIGIWNWELEDHKMKEAVNQLARKLNDNPVHCLVAHCPLYGIFDKTSFGHRIGNTTMGNALSYSIKNLPRLYLCGHCHNEPYIRDIELNDSKITISNAATTYRILEI